MKRCYLQKNICATIRDFNTALFMNYIADFSVYEENTLVSIFKWLVASKLS